MQGSTYRFIELLFLFILIPLSFYWEYLIAIKIGIVVVGFTYVLVLLKKAHLLKFPELKKIDFKLFFKEIAWKFLAIIGITICYVYLVAPDKLFLVVQQKPLLWLVILFVYAIFSVWPQEILYRTFFFYRYESLLKHKWGFIVLNAIIFSLAHIFLKNSLVQLLTFVGGVLFAYTYQKKRSTTLVSIEHILYGNWLFTVGMGEMLAFPE